jgi:hypothetical protein
MRFWVCLSLLALAACKHDDGETVGTATIHSGTPGGPKVTNLRTDPRADMGDELARAFCKHDRECAIEAPETALLREEACFSDSRGGTRASIEQWPCEPAAAREGFDRCLAAIHEASCSARIGEGAQVRECRADAICRRSQ